MKRKLVVVEWLWVSLLVLIFAIYEADQLGALPNSPALRKLALYSSSLPNQLRDIKFFIRGKKPPKNKIVILAIDSPAIEEFGRWPWRRDVLAFLVQKTFAFGARHVALDIVLSEQEHIVPEELLAKLKKNHLEHLLEGLDTNQSLVKVIERHRKNLTLSWISESPCQPKFDNCPVTAKEALASIPDYFVRFSIKDSSQLNLFNAARTPLLSFVSMLPNAKRFDEFSNHQGYGNGFHDVDGTIRDTYLVAMLAGAPHPSLPLAVMLRTSGLTPNVEFTRDSVLKELSALPSNQTFPVSPAGKGAINFRGPEGTFPYLSARDVLLAGESAEQSDSSVRQILKDAIVLVGATAAGLADITSTPMDSSIPGVEVHATVLDNLLSGDLLITNYSERAPWMVNLLLLGLMILGNVWLAHRVKRMLPVPMMLTFVGCAAVIFGVDCLLFVLLRRDWALAFLYLEMGGLLFLTVFKKYVFEEWERRMAQATVLEKEKQLLTEKLVRGKMETELKTAQLMQATLLKPPILVHPELELSHFYRPAAECGGDIWDGTLEGNLLSLYLGDATGHGAAAAIVTAVAKSCYDTMKRVIHDRSLLPTEALHLLNEIICSSCKGELLMTMSFAQIDLASGVVHLASAGHESPLCMRASEPAVKPAFDSFFSRGERLGDIMTAEFPMETYKIEQDDTLLIYSDGLIEAHNSEGAEWGERNLKKIMQRLGSQSLEKMRDGIVEALDTFRKGVAQEDDITFVLVRRHARAVVPQAHQTERRAS